MVKQPHRILEFGLKIRIIEENTNVFVLLYLYNRLTHMKKYLLSALLLAIISLSVSSCRVNKKRHCDDCPHFSQINHNGNQNVRL